MFKRSMIVGSLLLATALAFVAPSAVPAFADTLTSVSSGAYTLSVESIATGGFGVRIDHGGSPVHEAKAPLWVEIKNSDGTATDYPATYSAWTPSSGGFTATGSVTSGAGSRFDFTDVYTQQDATGAFKVTRSVKVGVASASDKGFASRFSINPLGSAALSDYDAFAPGNWYKQNANVVAGAFGSDYNDENFLIKETRLPLPLFGMRALSTGESLTMVHADAAPSSFESDSSPSWLVSASFNFGSLGIKKSPTPSLNYTYPSSEGDKNYYGNDGNRTNRQQGMVRRSDPVQAGLTQHYALILKAGQQGSFNEFESGTWRYAFDLYSPTVNRIDSNTLYSNDITYLLSVFKSFPNGAAGTPFATYTTQPTGPDQVYHLQSGFVGQQTRTGWELLREGYSSNNTVAKADGVAVEDFWANNSLTPSGLPKTDYFAEQSFWLPDAVFLRTESDAAEGMIDAYNTAYAHGDYHDNWLSYCEQFADFLVAHQASDGSWSRSYNQDGSVADSGKFNTSNPIRFLVKLYLATHDPRYLNSALHAGQWAMANIDQASAYVGGTPDNANTIDKEAGILALDAFNALYDVTSDGSWLSAAKNAANYVETWTYSYNFAVYPSTQWTAQGQTFPSWVDVDLGAQYPVTRIETMFEFGNAYYQYKLETSADNSSWSTFSDKTANTTRAPQTDYVDSGSATARYVRITVTGAEGPVWPAIQEFKVYGADGGNLAQNRPTTASSQLDAAHSASMATDGVVTSSANSPWPAAGLVGQSLVATGQTYTDTFMMAAPAEFYRLYVSTGDAHYLKYAMIIANDTNAVSDYDGRLGYNYRAQFGEGIMANNFTQFYGTETLNWQIGLQLESIDSLQDMFGYRNIDDIEANLVTVQKQSFNHLAYQPAYAKPAYTITDGAVYQIVNRNSGKLIDVQGGSTSNSGNIWQYHDLGATSQYWRAVAVGGGYWKLVNLNSGKLIDVEASSLANGANISQYADTGLPNQQWQIVGIGQGYWKLVNRNSGKLIDVEGSGRDDGRNISQYSDLGSPNQDWAFIQVPGY